MGDHIRDGVESNLIEMEDGEVSVTISIGVAQRDESMPTITSFLIAVDKALYEAKETGRNKVCLWETEASPVPVEAVSTR